MLNRFKTGLVLGCFVSLVHFIWAIAIAITPSGMQKFVDRILGLHFIQPTVIIVQPTRGKGILLIIMTFIVGYIMGMIFACLWNKLTGNKKTKAVIQPKAADKKTIKTKKRK